MQTLAIKLKKFKKLIIADANANQKAQNFKKFIKAFFRGSKRGKRVERILLCQDPDKQRRWNG